MAGSSRLARSCRRRRCSVYHLSNVGLQRRRDSP